MNILMIDDDQDILDSLEGILTMWDFKVKTFNNPADAIREYKSHSYDVVITDVRMPGQDGIDVLKAVKNHNPDAYVIVITGFADTATAIAALNLGAYSLIPKPPDIKDFLGTLEKIKTELKDRSEMKSKLENIEKTHVELDSVYEELQSFVVVVDQMQTISRKFHSALNLPFIFYELLNNTTYLLGCDFCLIALQSEDSNCISCFSNDNTVQENFLGKDGDYQDNPFFRSWFENGKIVLNNNPPDGLKSAIEQNGIRMDNYLSVPLPQNDHVLGFLAGFNKNGGFASGDKFLLNAVGGTAVTAISIFQLVSKLNRLFEKTIGSLAKAIDAKDAYTRGHTGRVSVYTRWILRELGWDQEKIEHAYIGTILHDIGKIGIPDSILNKAGKLTDAEFEVMKSHVIIGTEIIKDIPELAGVLDYLKYHHERYDGKGYPQGLKGEDIPLAGRIVCVADSFDAMTTDRRYRSALTLEEALKELDTCAGTQFDPKIVKLFIPIAREFGIISGIENLEEISAFPGKSPSPEARMDGLKSFSRLSVCSYESKPVDDRRKSIGL